MEMPFDILNTRLGKIRDNGDIDFDNTAVAADIDTILQEKFLSIPFEELEAIEIEEDRGRLNAGSGPEHCAAGEGENPNWLYHHAMNALALWWRLKKEQDALAKRPEPGVYQARMTEGRGEAFFTVIVDVQRRMWVPQDQGGTLNMGDEFDAGLWTLQRINLTDGTISK